MITARVMKRVPFVRDIIINGSMKVRAVDLSQGGLYVHTGRSNLTGQIVEVSIPYDGEYITVKAKVVHKQDAVGMGLMFIGLSFQDKLQIAQLIDEISDGSRKSDSSLRDGRKQVLLIEDNITTQRIYKSRLIFDGFSVLTANDCLEALTILKDIAPDTIDVIILDLYMEGLDGFHFLTASKEMPQVKDVPVIVLTARASADAMKRAKEMGAAKVLQKSSTSPAALTGSIKEALRTYKNSIRKINCWEFMRCGRTPYDGPIDEKKICPVSADVRLDGIHGGKNGGRACWVVAGSMCDGKLQGPARQKFADCRKCSFYRALKKEEGEHYCDSLYLLDRLH
jgi:CheY-like chemotaxis protein